MDSNLLQLLRVALGRQDALGHRLSAEEWSELRDEAWSQQVLGVGMVGAEKAMPEQFAEGEELPDVMFQWLADTQVLEERNALVDRRAAEVTEMLRADGYRTTVLKGQGLARMYEVPCRQQGSRGAEGPVSTERPWNLRCSQDLRRSLDLRCLW